MRIRTYPAVGFAVLILTSAYLGLAKQTIPSYKHSDKALHFTTFFLLTACFYWILETNRRRNLQLTLFVCTLVLGVGSEVIQGLLPNERIFDPLDIASNILGSLGAVSLCTWYHKRMLERKRKSKTYTFAPGENEEFDLELGDDIGTQHEGVIRGQTLDQEVDNWDENAQDWDDDDPTATDTPGEGSKTPSSSVEEGGGDIKARND